MPCKQPDHQDLLPTWPLMLSELLEQIAIQRLKIVCRSCSGYFVYGWLCSGMAGH